MNGVIEHTVANKNQFNPGFQALKNSNVNATITAAKAINREEIDDVFITMMY